MGSESEPAKLLLPYLQRADELQKHEPLVAYYCRLYAMERGLRIPQKERTKTTNALLISLMNQLEKLGSHRCIVMKQLASHSESAKKTAVVCEMMWSPKISKIFKRALMKLVMACQPGCHDTTLQMIPLFAYSSGFLCNRSQASEEKETSGVLAEVLKAGSSMASNVAHGVWTISLNDKAPSK